MTMKNAVFCDIIPRGSSNKRRFVAIYRLHLQNYKNRSARNKVSTGILCHVASVRTDVSEEVSPPLS
jgi:hypothetical protein